MNARIARRAVDDAMKSELTWCRNARGDYGNKDYERGFMDGLRHARKIAKEAITAAEKLEDK